MKPQVPRWGKKEKKKNTIFLPLLALHLSLSLLPLQFMLQTLSPIDIKERHRGRDITAVKSTKHAKTEYFFKTGKRQDATFQFTSISDLLKPAVFPLPAFSSAFNSIYLFIYLLYFYY